MCALTVLIVDDQRLVREGVASLLEIQEGIAVISTAVDGRQAVEQAVTTHPDVVLMDVRMPVKDGNTATRRIKQKLPACQVVMLTTLLASVTVSKPLFLLMNMTWYSVRIAAIPRL